MYYFSLNLFHMKHFQECSESYRNGRISHRKLYTEVIHTVWITNCTIVDKKVYNEEALSQNSRFLSGRRFIILSLVIK